MISNEINNILRKNTTVFYNIFMTQLTNIHSPAPAKIREQRNLSMFRTLALRHYLKA